MSDLKQLEAVVTELMTLFDVQEPPIPLDNMLQTARDDMWKQVDVSQLSGTFLRFDNPYAPRMSLARMLARHLVKSAWGQQHGLPALIKSDEDDDRLHRFARMIVMPYEMVSQLTNASRTPTAMSIRFEVPEEEARKRLEEID